MYLLFFDLLQWRDSRTCSAFLGTKQNTVLGLKYSQYNWLTMCQLFEPANISVSSHLPHFPSISLLIVLNTQTGAENGDSGPYKWIALVNWKFLPQNKPELKAGECISCAYPEMFLWLCEKWVETNHSTLSRFKPVMVECWLKGPCLLIGYFMRH